MSDVYTEFGTDPEFLILAKDNKPVPAWTCAPPKSAKIQFDYGNFFRDGYALEVNVESIDCRALLSNDVKLTLQRIQFSHLPPGCRLSTLPAVRVPKEHRRSAPPDCQTFGCKPALNAYTGELYSVKLSAINHPWRYFGGHLHISGADTFSMKNKENALLYVKMCDLFVGLPFAYLFDDDLERQRRKYYGRAGECRMQVYKYGKAGIEYRVPSPRVWNDHRVAQFMMGTMRSIIRNFVSLKKEWKTSWEKDLQKQINNCDVSEKWLQTVSGFYTPDLLVRLKKMKAFHNFSLLDTKRDCHIGFTEWCGTHFGESSIQTLLDFDKHQCSKPSKYTNALAV